MNEQRIWDKEMKKRRRGKGKEGGKKRGKDEKIEEKEGGHCTSTCTLNH